MADPRLYIGLDVGSTTVKAVVVDPTTDEILWQDYQRHETKQPEKCLEFLTMIETDFPIPHDEIRVFITGSGGSGIAPRIGAKFVQEVNAVSLAVEKLYPACGSVIELGGQDAKIIIFKEDPETGQEEEDPVDERQVRRWHRRRHRQDQREAAHPAGAAVRHGLHRHQAAPRCGQVRRVRRDRRQLPAEDGRAERPAHGVPLRRDHRPEPVRADTRQHPPARGAAARRPEHVHPRHGRGVAGQHPADLGGARHAAARGRRPAGPDQGPRERAVLRGARRGRVRPVRGSRRRRLPRHQAPSPLHRRRPRRGEGGVGQQGPLRDPGGARRVQGALQDPQVQSGRSSSPARWWRRSSDSTAAPPPPRRCCSTRTATSSSRATSSPRATPSSTPRRCSASWSSTSRTRAPPSR